LSMGAGFPLLSSMSTSLTVGRQILLSRGQPHRALGKTPFPFPPPPPPPPPPHSSAEGLFSPGRSLRQFRLVRSLFFGFFCLAMRNFFSFSWRSMSLGSFRPAWKAPLFGCRSFNRGATRVPLIKSSLPVSDSSFFLFSPPMAALADRGFHRLARPDGQARGRMVSHRILYLCTYTGNPPR